MIALKLLILDLLPTNFLSNSLNIAYFLYKNVFLKNKFHLLKIKMNFIKNNNTDYAR